MFDGVGRERWKRATNLIFLFFLRGPEQQQNRRQYEIDRMAE